MDWLEADPYGFPLEVDNPDGEAEEAEVDVMVEDDDCGAMGYDIADVAGAFNEEGESIPDCVVNLADFAVFFNQWLLCTEPYDDAGECGKLWDLVEEE